MAVEGGEVRWQRRQVSDQGTGRALVGFGDERAVDLERGRPAATVAESPGDGSRMVGLGDANLNDVANAQAELARKNCVAGFATDWLWIPTLLAFAASFLRTNALRGRCRTRCVYGVAWLIVGRAR